MEQYLIKPWDTRDGTQETQADWDMHVPPEVDAIAEQVIGQYDMSVSSRTLITSKPDKGGAIWRIETNKGPRSLKVLHRTPERSLYSVGLQDYVVQKGARVPALIPAKDGKLFVEMGGKLWIVTDWIALQPATKVDLTGAQELCYGLGEFHHHTKGYSPPLGAKNSSRLYRWPNYYQKVAKKIGWMREMAKSYQDTIASKSILAVVDQYEQQAIEALNWLKTSAYPSMVAMGEAYWGLVHQDYGWSNGQNGPGGLWVIDLDGVSYDLPFRDLRKLITSTMDDMGVWDVSWMRGMIEAYHQANPLDRESFEVLLNDMAMPNEFYKHLKEMFFDPVTFLNTEAEAILQRVISTDQTKSHALAELAKDASNYESGNYEQALAAREPKREASEVARDVQNWVLQPQETTAASIAASAKEEQRESSKATIKVSRKKSADKDSDDSKKAAAKSKEKKKKKATVNSEASIVDPIPAKKEQPQVETVVVESRSSGSNRSRNKKTFKVESQPAIMEAPASVPEELQSESPEKIRKKASPPSTSRNNVIDFVSHLEKKKGKTAKSKKPVSKKQAASVKKPAQKTKGSTSASVKKPTKKWRAKSVIKSASESPRKARTGKQGGAKLSQNGKKSASQKRSVSPAKTLHAPVSKTLVFSKVAAPSRKMASTRANKPRAQKGLKVNRGR